MSSPVTVSGSEASDLHQSAGIWKSPRNWPDEISVSTRVNPVAPRPSSDNGTQPTPVSCHFTSSNVTSSNLP